MGLVITKHLLAYWNDAGGCLLSSSPRIVVSLFLSVVDSIDNARGRRTAHDKRTKAEDDADASDGTNRSRGRCTGPVAGGGEYEG